MNANPDTSKLCYRCDQVVRLTAEQFRADPAEVTCCPTCRDKLNVEAEFAGAPLSPQETDSPTPPLADLLT